MSGRTVAVRFLGLSFLGVILLARLSSAQSSENAQLLSQLRVFVREFRFEGNTAFSAQELALVTEPYVNRGLTSGELEDARRAVTLHYVSHGYINSGAILPDQDPSSGIIKMRIIEGKLSEIRLAGTNEFFHSKGWLSPQYLTDRLSRWAGPPLNINNLKDGLQILRQNPNIKQVNAALEPGVTPGEGVLAINVKEQNPFRLAITVDNQRPPSVGAEEILLRGADRNLTGHSDVLEFTYGIARSGKDGWFEFSGIDDAAGSYTLPITARDTTLQVFGSTTDSLLIEEPFTTLNVKSRVIRYGGTVRQPVYQTPNSQLVLGITLDRAESETTLLGKPFDISPGSVHGRQETTVLRLSQEWIDRNQNQVIALRSTFNIGLDAFGTTDDGTDRDAKFFSWLGQAQYVRRLGHTQNLLVLRVDGQWTDGPLLALEQFSVGGFNTVRGYRENTMVRDRGLATSAEVRIPVLFDKTRRPIVQLAPFYDFGGGWNLQSGTPDPRTIMSAGIGVLVNPNKHLFAQLYWGHRFTHVDNPQNNAQDLGLHFNVTFETF